MRSMVTGRKYPVGIQTFSEIIRNGYVYVDKTDLVWQMTHYAKYIFLSRPRRFGKSLLTSTLESYFRGEKELFKGLKIMALEQDWEQYPVLRFDMSLAKGQDTAEDLRAAILLILKPYMKLYGKDDDEKTPGSVLSGLIERAFEQTKKQVAVIIDEYDAPLLEVIHESGQMGAMRKVMQEFYQPLKACEAKIKFCFITGITKFSQLSIFSTINNLTNVTMDTMFATICGMTERELTTTLWEDIERLAAIHELTAEEMHDKLKKKYDGYHFARASEGVYNPYSLLKAFQQRELRNWWFESGTPSFLILQLQRFNTDIMQMERLEVPSEAFDQPTENMQDALPLLYQSGYLTIKDYDRFSEAYTLSIPNQEVRIGYVNGLMPVYTGLKSADVQMGFAAKFWKALRMQDVEQAMQELKAYMAGIPYVEGFKKKLAEAATAEGFYEYTLYLIFSMLNVYVRTQVKCSTGRTDMVVWMPDVTYVFEFKTNQTAREALEQIDTKGYAFPYHTEGRKVVKIGVRFNADNRIPEEWVIA
ncbi:MAG: ATP-binding protein [Prevotella sp.]|nr:ATP-binding protein [Prevotella sp.]